MYGELASVQGIVDLSPQEALDRAEGFLASQGYVIGQRTYTTITAQRQAGGETGGEDLPNLTVAVAPQLDGGVRITVRGNDQAGVQERQAAWMEWSESLPKKPATQIEEAGERTVEVPDAVLPPPPQAEADVSVPPAPQAREEHRPRISLGQFLVGFLVVIGVLWLLIPTGDGSRSGGGSGNSGGGNQAVAPEKAKQDDRPNESKAAPEPKPEPKPEPEPEPEPISFSGNASQATDFFELEEGLAVFNFSHQGQMNFIATLLDEQGREVAFALGNEIGTFQSSSAVRIPKAGRYVLDVDADGSWSATVRQPRPADAPEKTSFHGDNNAATPIFSLSSGLKRITATHQGQGNFIVTMLDSEGREVAFALINEIGTGEFSTTLTVPQDGLYLFTVEAEGPWTLDVE